MPAETLKTYEYTPASRGMFSASGKRGKKNSKGKSSKTSSKSK